MISGSAHSSDMPFLSKVSTTSWLKMVIVLEVISTYRQLTTGHHRGLKWKLRAGYKALSLQHMSYLCVALMLRML